MLSIRNRRRNTRQEIGSERGRAEKGEDDDGRWSGLAGWQCVSGLEDRRWPPMGPLQSRLAPALCQALPQNFPVSCAAAPPSAVVLSKRRPRLCQTRPVGCIGPRPGGEDPRGRKSTRWQGYTKTGAPYRSNGDRDTGFGSYFRRKVRGPAKPTFNPFCMAP